MLNHEFNDLIVFSHFRWNFIFQRPQHILSRQSKHRRVYYFEDPLYGLTEEPKIQVKETSENVLIVTPYLPSRTDPQRTNQILTRLIDELIYDEEILDFSLWYYDPLALGFSRHLLPQNIIFDCMDELFSHNQPNSELLKELETELIYKSDLIFMNGHTLYQSKKHLHKNIHFLPSSIDLHHFSQARHRLTEPDDQVYIPHPRIGFYGVIDQRVDLELIQKIAEQRPSYQFIIVGPIINIDSKRLPLQNNIHFLGKKDYDTLPLYIAGWDCTIMPYYLNEYTQYTSPAKTLELLAAGKPIVSTPLPDIIYPYQKEKIVHTADTPENFIAKIDLAMNEKTDPSWIDRVESYLEDNNWDSIFNRMAELEASLSPKWTRDANISSSL